MQLSYTKLKTFHDCRGKYRMAYVERLPRPPIAHLQFERKVHKALAQYHALARLDGSVDLDALLLEYHAMWELTLKNGKPENMTRLLTQRDEGEDILRAYADRERRLQRVPLYTELQLTAEYGPYVLTGKIDRVDARGDGYAILDYKLDRELPPGEPAAAKTSLATLTPSHQLDFYQLLLYQGKGHFADSVSLLYLRHATEKAAPRSRADLARTTDWIDRTVREIHAEKQFDYTEGDGCKTCPFKRHCPLKTGEARVELGVWQQSTLGLFPD